MVPAPDYSQLAARQRERLAAARQKRDTPRAAATLEELKAAARTDEPLMPRIVEAVRARTTLGEISNAFRAIWGTYQT